MSEYPIPPNYIAFCKAVAKLASDAGFSRVGLTITPSYDTGWTSDVQLRWDSGRHGEDSAKLYITSTIQVHAMLTGSQ